MSEKNNDRQELLDKARGLGLEFPQNITEVKLKLMITEALEVVKVPKSVLEGLQAQIDELKKHEAPVDSDNGTVDALVHALNINSGNSGLKVSKGISVEDTPNKENKIQRALTLIRCTIIPRDPSKVNRRAEVITMANDLVGDLRYKVPFNTETHIPFAIYSILISKKINIFDDTIKSGNKETGEVMGGYRAIDAYSINVLPKLTEAEIKALGRKQKLRSEALDEREDAILGDEKDEEEVPKTQLEQMGYDL